MPQVRRSICYGAPTGSVVTITPSTLAAGASATNVSVTIKVPASAAAIHRSGNQPGLGGQSTPVQNQVPPGQVTEGAFWPHVSYNTCLQRYLMTFETNDGYYYSTSSDLVTWKLQGRFFSFPGQFDHPNPHDTWYAYQTLISPEQTTDQVTSCSGYLYYAKRQDFSAECHSLYRRPFTITQVPATLRVAPTALHFPTMIELAGISTTSAPRYVTLVNAKNRSQNVAFSINSIDLSGDFAKAGTTTCGSILSSGASCKIGITFSPTAPRLRTGSLTIATNASGSSTIGITLNGTGRQGVLTYGPRSLNFGNQNVGSQSKTRNVRLLNKNPVPMSFDMLPTGPFTITSNTCTGKLGPNGTCSIGLAFTPTASGRAQGSLTILDEALGSPHVVTLIGTGR